MGPGGGAGAPVFAAGEVGGEGGSDRFAGFSWVVISVSGSVWLLYCCHENTPLLPCQAVLLLYVKFIGKNLKRSKTFGSSDEELALLARLSEGRSMTETIVDGLKALDQRGQGELVEMRPPQAKGKR